jgi:hypothetical protein
MMFAKAVIPAKAGIPCQLWGIPRQARNDGVGRHGGVGERIPRLTPYLSEVKRGMALRQKSSQLGRHFKLRIVLGIFSRIFAISFSAKRRLYTGLFFCLECGIVVKMDWRFFMKIRRGLYVLGLCGALALGAAFFGPLVGFAAGGPDDPMVTQSYVHQAIERALAGVSGISGVVACEGAIFTPVQVFAGQVILGHEGTEMILRSGEALANVPGADGIVNATSGIDLFHGSMIPNNNYLIIPRADGRGIWALTDIWLIVKGDFDIITTP